MSCRPRPFEHQGWLIRRLCVSRSGIYKPGSSGPLFGTDRGGSLPLGGAAGDSHEQLRRLPSPDFLGSAAGGGLSRSLSVSPRAQLSTKQKLWLILVVCRCCCLRARSTARARAGARLRAARCRRFRCARPARPLTLPLHATVRAQPERIYPAWLAQDFSACFREDDRVVTMSTVAGRRLAGQRVRGSQRQRRAGEGGRRRKSQVSTETSQLVFPGLF